MAGAAKIMIEGICLEYRLAIHEARLPCSKEETCAYSFKKVGQVIDKLSLPRFSSYVA